MGSPIQTPFTDLATPILRADPVLSDENRADLFDIFHDSKNPEELAQKLQPLLVPDDTKRKLLAAKQTATPVLDPLDKTTAAIKRVSELDATTLDLAEAHPNVLKALTTAAMTPEKAPEAAGATAGAGKGKTAGAAKSPSAVPQTPRPDGLPHMQPIDPLNFRVMASDGGLHDIPRDRIEEARNLDPRLHVLNP